MEIKEVICDAAYILGLMSICFEGSLRHIATRSTLLQFSVDSPFEKYCRQSVQEGLVRHKTVSNSLLFALVSNWIAIKSKKAGLI
jgi:hypothetical protein